jgi:hypothetical protein
MIEEIASIPLPVLSGVILILLIQSTLLFIDARKRNQYPWIWGIVGLIQFPFPTIFYLIFVRKAYKKIWSTKKIKG